MSATNPIYLIDQITVAVDELRRELFLGPAYRDADGGGIAIPLIAASDPVNPTAFAFIRDGRVSLVVERIAPMHSFQGFENLLIRFKEGRVQKVRISNLLLALLAALTSNRPDESSCIGLDGEDGNIFLKDHISAMDFEPVMFKEWFKCIVERARTLRSFLMQLNLGLPDSPEPPFPNCFPTQ